MPLPMEEPLRIFISYSHRDAKLKDALLDHLRPVQGVDVWTDDCIAPGADWREEIEKGLAQADIALLLVSPSFLGSRFIQDYEVPDLLERQVAQGLVVIPVILRDCAWQELPVLERLAPLPKRGEPITRHKDYRRDRAFKEVATEIARLARKRDSSGTSQPLIAELAKKRGAPPAPGPTAGSALWQLRAPPGDFTGRTEELEDLRARIGESGVIIAGLTGQGGVGKTALALRLAHDLRARYPDAQLDIDLLGSSAQPLKPDAVMQRVLHAFEPGAKPPENEAELAGRYRSVLASKRVLLFFDNARDRAQVDPLAPPPGCLMLVTSRQHFTLPGIYTRRLDTLAKADAIALVRRMAPRLDEPTAAELAKLCGYLPLALRAAASTLSDRVDMKPVRYIEKLRAARVKFKEVDAVLSESLELLDEATRRFWLRLGIMTASFDAAAAAAIGSLKDEEAEDELSELVRRSLLDWDGAAERYQMHDLARDYALARLEPSERYIANLLHADHFLGVLRTAEVIYLRGGDSITTGLGLFDARELHVVAAREWAAVHAERDDGIARIACELQIVAPNILTLRQNPRERLMWLERALSIARRMGRSAVLPSLIGSLGLVHWKLGERRKAVHLFECLLAISKDQQTKASALGNLGSIYVQLKNERKAIAFSQRRLAIARKIGSLGSVAKSFGSIGVAYRQLGDFDKAIEYLKQYLVMGRKIKSRREEAKAIANIGIVHGELSNNLRAIELFSESLDIFQQLSDHYHIALVSWHLGLEYEKVGELRRAVDAMQVRVDYERQVGHRDVAEHEAHVARLRARMGE